MTGRVLILDGERATCEGLAATLERRGFSVAWQTTTREALLVLDEQDFDVVVTDLQMEGLDGLAVCERVAANHPEVPLIVTSASATFDSALAAIRAGACDFITKPFDVERLRLSLARAVQHHGLRDEVKRLREAVRETRASGEMIGVSRAIHIINELVDRIADTEVTVLLTGESGTGKELVARALHARSRRAGGPFVAVNCAAVPEALLESELFGHTKGAFTDARGPRRGLFLKASGGTLFLDEIADLPPGMQPKLLRALQERRVRAVGSDSEEAHDARIVTATNRDLETEVEEHRFREDLFYRINVVRIVMPPLRARDNDVLLLAQHFVQRFSSQMGKAVTGLSEAVAEKLLAYSWPGNVRELQNCIERAVALTRYDALVVDDLPEKVRDHHRNGHTIPGIDPVELMPLEEVERRYILRVLKQMGGNKTTAAEVLHLDRRTLHRKLERYGTSLAPAR